jgi:FMN phosphatase YigB (HAD superfamily)
MNLQNRKTVIFDIDGTLADVRHREHFVQGEEKDFDSFFAAMDKDLVNYPIADLFYRHIQYEDQIILCSGRPDTYRDVTQKWLKEELMSYLAKTYMPEKLHCDIPNLLMRPSEKLYTPDWIIKQEILDGILKHVDKSNIMYAVDDRAQVVKMWRDNGITCLQVDEGNF